MQHSFYIYTSSKYCKDLFPQNFNGEHNVKLSQPVHLEGKWSCGLVDYIHSAKPQHPIYVCCNLLSDLNTGEHTIPILRQVDLKTSSFENVLYVPVKQQDFDVVQVYVRTLENRPLPRSRGINRGDSSALLHFRRQDDDDDR